MPSFAFPASMKPAARKEMLSHVRVYTDHVKELASLPGAVLHVEVRVKINDQIWGTADAIVWDPASRTLYVRDLKYGAGVVVEARGNLQLKIYALAAMLTMGYPAEVINVGISQPRAPHEDGHNRSVDYDVVDLVDFHADVLDATAGVKDAFFYHDSGDMAAGNWEDTFLKPSEKGCKWCLAAPTCPQVKKKAQALAKQAFAPGLPYDPKALTETLDFVDILEAWIKNVREFAYREAEQGRVPPTYKLVPKRATRKWRTDLDVKALAQKIGLPPKDLFKPEELLGVTEIEKMCPGKSAKERGAVLVDFVTKESSGHTLVHESDQREAVRLDAKSAFDDLPLA